MPRKKLMIPVTACPSVYWVVVSGAAPGVAGVIKNYVADNMGLTNVAVAYNTGSGHITQKLFNYLNINLLNFQVSNQDQIKPVLSNFLHLMN